MARFGGLCHEILDLARSADQPRRDLAGRWFRPRSAGFFAICIDRITPSQTRAEEPLLSRESTSVLIIA